MDLDMDVVLPWHEAVKRRPAAAKTKNPAKSSVVAKKPAAKVGVVKMVKAKGKAKTKEATTKCKANVKSKTNSQPKAQSKAKAKAEPLADCVDDDDSGLSDTTLKLPGAPVAAAQIQAG